MERILKSILIIGAGFIVISRACELDYSGVQRVAGDWCI
jgi:hypothetical protein